MIKSITLFIFITCFFILQSQAQTISGNLLEETTKEPVSFATLALYKALDSTFVQAVITDVEGKFNFPKVANGNYYLEVNMLGYERKKISGVQVNGNNFNPVFKDLSVKEDKVKLEEVVVEATKEVIQQTESGTIVNADANLTQTGGTAVDILKNVPGVVVDSDGNITLRGTGANILIDGRNSSLGNNLQQIPASAIESIEIINSPSAKYDATGEGGIINIRLKKNKKQGLNGTAGASIGSQDLYTTSLRLNYKAQKINFFGGFDTRYSNSIGYNLADRNTFPTVNNPLTVNLRTDQYRTANDYDQSYNIVAGMDFDLGKKTRITLEGLYNYNKGAGFDNLSSTFIDRASQLTTSINNRKSNDVAENQLMEYTLSFKQGLKQKGQELSGFYTYSNNNRSENTNVFSETRQPSGITTGTSQQRLYNKDPFQFHVAQLDFVQPIKDEVLVLETGYKINYRTIRTESGIQNLEAVSQQWIDQTTNKFNYDEQVHALYFLLRGKKDKWSYNAGLRAENTIASGATDFNNLRFSKDYLNFFPNLRVNYQINKANSIRASYSARINRPSTGNLNPFRDVSDSLNIRTGNPDLNPEIIHAAELNYGFSIEKFSFTPTFFYRYRDNSIQRTVSVDNNAISTFFPRNVGYAYTYGLDLTSTYQPLKWWDMSANFSLFENVVQGLNNDVIDVARSSISWTGRFINNFTFWKDLKMQVTASYSSPFTTAQGELIERYFVDFGMTKNVLKKKGRVGFVVTDVFNTLEFGFSSFGDNFTQTRLFKRNTQRFILSFTYQFGKPFQERRRRVIGDENRED